MPVRILVTGGSGFVGNAVLQALRERHPDDSDYLLFNADLVPPRTQRPWQHLRLNILDPVDLDAVFARVRPTVVVHTAGVVPGGAARYDRAGEQLVLRLNVGGTANVLSAASKHGVEALVFTSSCCLITDDYAHEYPNYDEATPVPSRSLTYGESKAASERLVLDANSPSFPTCALRPSVILGPGDYQLVPALHACIAKGETPYALGATTNLYDFTYISNVADAHALAVENLLSEGKTAAGQAFNITNGQPITFRDFMLAVWAGFGHVPPFTLRIPGPLAWAAGAVAELFSWVSNTPSTLSRGSVNDAIWTRYANIDKARRVLGYEPRVSLDEGVRLSCEAYKKVLAANEIPAHLISEKKAR